MKVVVYIDTDTKTVIMEPDDDRFEGWSMEYSGVYKGVENVTIGELIEDALQEYTEYEE